MSSNYAAGLVIALGDLIFALAAWCAGRFRVPTADASFSKSLAFSNGLRTTVWE